MRQSISFITAILASNVFAKYHAHILYSPDEVVIGSANSFAMTWEQIYAASGTEHGVVVTNSRQAQASECKGGGSDITVSVIIEGKWGALNGIDSWGTRNALIQAFEDFRGNFVKKTRYDMWSNCEYVNGRNALTSWWPKTSACASSSCGTHCGSTSGLQCRYHNDGFKFPATVQVTLKDDAGRLLNDELTVKFASTAKSDGGGCGIAGDLAGALAGAIPGSGSFFSTGISVACQLV